MSTSKQPSSLPSNHPQTVCHSTSTFIAHLVNQAVAHEILALQMVVLLLERPTDDSVEIAVGFMREVGAFLGENAPKANNTVYERFRAILNEEKKIDVRVQYMIEVLFQVRKDKYKDNPILPEGLDLVQEEDQITHQISLDDDLQIQESLRAYHRFIPTNAIDIAFSAQKYSKWIPTFWRTRKNTRRSRLKSWGLMMSLERVGMMTMIVTRMRLVRYCTFLRWICY